MLHAFLIAGAMVQVPSALPAEVKTRVVSAAVFKPGVALIVREAHVPKGKGRYKLDVLPDILEGSFWYGSPDGAVVGDVQTRLRFEETTTKIEAKTIAEFLLASEGKPVRMTVNNSKGDPEPLSGTILASATTGGWITLRLPNGNIRSVQAGQVMELDTTGLNSTYERKIPVVVQEIAFEAEAAKPATVRFMTLENTAAWSGSYLVTLNTGGSADVTAKAQIVVGSLTLENTDVQVLAGLPALPTTPKFDLVAGFGSMVAWLRGTQESYRAYRPNRDPYSQIAQVFQDAQNRARMAGSDPYGSTFANYGYGGGGFGGGGQGAYFGGNPGMDIDSNFSGNRPSGAAGEEVGGGAARVEDLFAYPLGKLSMAPGDRVTRQFLKETAPYERLYRWEVAMKAVQYQQPTERSRVLKILRLTNKGKSPWTGGLALVMKDGSPLAQTDMPYAAPGQEANIELGEVQDVPVTKDAKEIKREQTQQYNRQYTLITVETRLSVENTRTEAFTIEVRHDVVGEVLEAPGAEIAALGTALNAANKNSRVTWTITLKPGEKRELSYTYKTLV